ncbi:MAG: Holliday junction branch migration protein RuvA [Desulfarculaceae bacterium]|jgi:Holliday junction DNA helicase RuvA
MIARLTGNLINRRPDHLVVDVGGVGYRVFVSLNSFYELPDPGSQVSLLVQTVVRDDAIHLYGFLAEAEREAFIALTGVSGVGPKLALSILSGITPDELWLAVRGRDTARLVKVPGIGKKTAARLVVELEGKLPEPGADQAATGRRLTPVAEDAVSALVNLGYPEARARQTVDQVLSELEPQASIEEILRQTLKHFK